MSLETSIVVKQTLKSTLKQTLKSTLELKSGVINNTFLSLKN
jgi:hypothetical protein